MNGGTMVDIPGGAFLESGTGMRAAMLEIS
ncbi:hypothetical protein SCE1572_52525 [Sorangium cellulosum So0157-2]|uniref:Uncharacterized protein n=1 Tax=Sorangium cellulosum So0157-2 TaxID=1254432 RepID=S4YC24_SORCE|nr:hypothetical protein SCE1572_52525 [Sorangium cellulosum So0157-2]